MSEETHTDKETSSKIIERHQIQGSPYWIIGNQEDGYSLRFGKYKLTENKPTVQEIEIDLDKNILNVILQTILAVTTEQNITHPHHNETNEYKQYKNK